MKAVRLSMVLAFMFATLALNAQVSDSATKSAVKYQPFTYFASGPNTIIKSSYNDAVLPSVMSCSQYVANLPVFCSIEHKLELKSKIPVRFRLGNLDYVNTLEGK